MSEDNAADASKASAFQSTGSRFEETAGRLRVRATEARQRANDARRFMMILASVSISVLLFVALGGGEQLTSVKASESTKAANTALESANSILIEQKTELATLQGREISFEGELIIVHQKLKDTGPKQKKESARPSAQLNETPEATTERYRTLHQAALLEKERLVGEQNVWEDESVEAHTFQDMIDSQNRLISINILTMDLFKNGIPLSSARQLAETQVITRGLTNRRDALNKLSLANQEAKTTLQSLIGTGEKELGSLRETANRSTENDVRLVERVQANSVANSITRIATTAGAIGIAILLMQVFISSNRYHLRLAEDYETQADSLLAANGDPDLAFKMIASLSISSIDFGKAPTTLYEKAIDALASRTQKL